MKRSPMPRGTKRLSRSRALARRTRLNAMSEQTAGRLPEREAVRRLVWARDRSRCVAKDLVPEVTCEMPLEVDEIVPRGVWAEGQYVPENCQLVCRAHHRWKHGHAERAVELGLRRWSWEER